MDGIALALTYSLHLQDGHFLEGSWDNYFYTRQWNVPPERRGASSCRPTADAARRRRRARGRGHGVAAVACAYARATGTMPTQLPDQPRRAARLRRRSPTVPPIPQSPTDGLDHTY